MPLNTFATQNWHWLSGPTNPSIYAGYEHDFYLNTTTGAVFEKTARYVWTYRGILSPSSPAPGGNIELGFTAANWSGNTITVIPSGVPGAGQIGPHNIPSGKVLYTSTQMKTGSQYQEVFIEVNYDLSSNTIVIQKTSDYPAFDGAILISYGN